MRCSTERSSSRTMWRAGAIAILSCLLGRTAAAQSSTGLSAADGFFREGRTAAKQGDFARACVAFHQSYGLDPAPGTLLNIADCEERTGHLLNALLDFNTTTHLLPAADDRLPIARARAANLDKHLPHLVVQVVGGSGTSTITLEGVPDSTSGSAPPPSSLLSLELLGKPIPVVAGAYVVHLMDGANRKDEPVTVSGVETSIVSFDVDAMERDRKALQTVAELQQRVAEEAAAAAQARAQATAEANQRAAQSMFQEDIRQRVAAAQSAGKPGAMIGIGLGFFVPAALAITGGSITGAAVLSDKTTVAQNCKGNLCSQDGIDAANDGKTESIVSTVLFGVGAALVATGIYILIKYDRAHPSMAFTVRGAPGGGQFGLEQAF